MVPATQSDDSPALEHILTVVSDYQVFKEDHLWHSWHCHPLTTGRSHNVDNVLNLSYSPSDPNDIAQLKEQKRFVFQCS
jgi:hypothetical protein